MTSYSPYLTLDRTALSQISFPTNPLLTTEQFHALLGSNELIQIDELTEVYWPLAILLHKKVVAEQTFNRELSYALGHNLRNIPYIIGIAGSVAVGKSTTSRLLQALLSQFDDHPHVQLVTTDGFLYPNQTLQERGIMDKKGFPQSYNTKQLLQFLSDVKAGSIVKAPVYSHITYDIVPEQYITVSTPDILIIEGINLLQVNIEAPVNVSDFFNCSIYVDASLDHLEQWYIERFKLLRRSAFHDPDSYFKRYANMDEETAISIAQEIWNNVNLVNLLNNILPTRNRAQLILHKGEGHRIQQLRIRN